MRFLISLCVSLLLLINESTTSSSDPCYDYHTLDEYWRDIQQSQDYRYDDTLVEWSGWYRLYLNGKSAQMSEWCVSYVGCGGKTGLHLNSSHPTLEDGVVTREVLGTYTLGLGGLYSHQCGAYMSTSIQVKACPGDYFVYKLVKPDVSMYMPSYCAVAFQNISSDPCYNYESLDRPWRANNESGDYICDNSFSWNGWYRLFYHGMNIRMSETCVSSFTCNTVINLWLSDPHPQIEDGVVIREVCASYWGGCCDYKTNPIRVKACPGNYYVYELVNPQWWCSGYCTDVSTISQVVSTTSLDIINGSSTILHYDPCSNYNILDNYWRNTLNYWYVRGYVSAHDDALVEWDGWYRLFINGSSAQMPEWCASYMACGGYTALYLGDSHPRLEDGVVTREIYGSHNDQCSRYRSDPIQVKACPGNYYVYKFTRPPLSIPAPAYCAVSFTTPSINPCFNYTSLDEPWRSTDNTYNNGMCDYNVQWNGWYRLFYNGQNAQMPESCVNQFRCGTDDPLWLNGPHPQLEDGVVTRQVCVPSWGGCCTYTSHPIRVKACPGDYYVYEFVKPPFCGAYCVDASNQSISSVSTTTERVPSTESITPSTVKSITPPITTTAAPEIFYPFGSSEDTRNAAADDGSSSKIQLLRPFLFFGRTYQQIYVNNNGHITFNQSSSQFIPYSFPANGSQDIIAGLWTDLNNNARGVISYNQYTNGSVLARATLDINNHFPNLTFNASWVFVATWDKVPYISMFRAETSFQVILISGSNFSFILMNYGDTSVTGLPVEAGYDTVNSIHYFVIPGSVNGSSISNLKNSSNVNVAGRWAFRVDGGHKEASNESIPEASNESIPSASTTTETITEESITPPITTTAAPEIFYPFGSSGDTRNAAADDGSSSKIQLLRPFLFFGRTYQQIYVNNNGHITFNQPSSQFVPYSFPANGSQDIIAGLWTDLNNGARGVISYNQYTNGSVLARATLDINNNFPNLTFNASWVFVATWDKVAYISMFRAETSFQVVLISGSNFSFILMNFGDTSVTGLPVEAGYDTVNSIHYFVIPGSVNGSSIPNLKNSSNVNVAGRWAFRVDGGHKEASSESIPSASTTTETITEESITPPITSTAAPEIFYPFGSSGDTRNAAADDGSSSKIQLLRPFLFFGRTYQQIYVNNNGHLTFNQSSSQFIPYSFPANGSQDIIAGLWTDLDNRARGVISYHQYTNGSVLTRATQDINNHFPNLTFNASWVFVATWDKVPYISMFRAETSFQVILISGSNFSFILMNYGDTSVTGLPVEAGYDTVNSIHYFVIPGSVNGNSIPNLKNSSNVNVAGRWAFRVDGGHKEASSESIPLASTTTETITEESISSPITSTAAPEIFYPFGSSGDTRNAAADDGSSSKIQLLRPFLFFGRTYQQIYVNNNGHITFNQPSSQFIPYSFPANGSQDIIAGLWTDLNNGARGVISYNQYTNGSVLTRATQDINNHFPNLTFNASWVFVATWDKVPYFSMYRAETSFQVVLISGSNFSFILMNYGDTSVTGVMVEAGYDTVNSIHYFVIPGSVNGSSIPNLKNSSNVNVAGRWAFRVDGGHKEASSESIPSASTTTETITEESITPPITSTAAPEIFYPFGSSGDTRNAAADDGSSSKIQLLRPFLFFGRTYQQIYVNNNGHLTFNQSSSQFIPYSFPANGSQDIIAGLWTDLNNGARGVISYHQYTNGSVLTRATLDINNHFPNLTFNASWVFVATWDKVPYFSMYRAETSFQVVLISGNNFSFILMNYGDTSVTGVMVEAGYDTVNSLHYFVIPGSVNGSSFPNLKNSSNVNVAGRWAFRVDGGHKVDRNPCSELSCSEDERCGMKNGVYGCLCKKDNHRPQPHSDSFDFSESCESSSGSMSVSRCQLFEAGFPADVLHLNDPSCKGTVRNGRVEFHFDNDEHICGTNLVANSTHFIYNNFILGTPRSEGLIISREKILKLSFSCVYPQTETLSMNVEINSLESIVQKILPAGEGRYRVRMIPYQDDEFTRPFTGVVDAELDQEMHVEVRVEGVDSRQFALVMDTCWATPVNDPDYSLRWDLIVSECPNPNDDTVELLQNGVSTSSRFSFRMFIFTANSTKLYLHCAVHLCLLSSNRCSMDCDSGHQRRERRSLDFHDSASISMGPLMLSEGNTDKWVPDQVKVSEASCLCGSLMVFLVPLMSVLTHF
ncbi:uncharacterized protein LOC125255412 isoform X1 [Megalobrama amblycephala]|uniref:uncharacterized protein LOC125255412 isoform X1 n=1 Tax=Megalobrama amblycephala TaxID=75352 RepID=UPI00201474BC|nr:uncharacterized protein LOC125255412 isoform X1 [Megalobrama amblycephala]